MSRISAEEKARKASALSKSGRKISNIANLVKKNEAPRYSSEGLRARSAATKNVRGARFSRVASNMAKTH